MSRIHEFRTTPDLSSFLWRTMSPSRSLARQRGSLHFFRDQRGGRLASSQAELLDAFLHVPDTWLPPVNTINEPT